MMALPMKPGRVPLEMKKSADLPCFPRVAMPKGCRRREEDDDQGVIQRT
jgi:hypothetical protein